jgi:hypothetical protein
VAMALDDLRTEVSVFEPRDSDVLQAPASAHHADRYRGPRRLRGTDRSPRSRAVRHVRGRRLRPDGDAGAPRASGRDSGADRGLLQPGSAPRGAAVPRAVEQRRAGNHQLALDVISGRHTLAGGGDHRPVRRRRPDGPVGRDRPGRVQLPARDDGRPGSSVRQRPHQQLFCGGSEIRRAPYCDRWDWRTRIGARETGTENVSPGSTRTDRR